MDKQIVLTGDRPTGKLHLGHYIGSLKNRLDLQNSNDYEMFILLADQQALTDNAKNPDKIIKSIEDVALDYLAVGLDPLKSTIFIQSQIPQLSELYSYFSNLVTINNLLRNPTIKNEISQRNFNKSIPAGFLNYPIAQAADILAFKADLVPVGDDQKPMIELTNKIVRSFNLTYNTNILKPISAIYPNNNFGRLLGTDRKNKMSKSLNNAIFLSDDMDTIKSKVMKLYTDPDHINIDDPGKIENNMVFYYIDAISNENDKPEIEKLKSHYQRGGLSDKKTKKYLIDLFDRELSPIRNKRNELSKDMTEVYNMLKIGCDKAKYKAEITLDQVKSAMGINYF